VLKRPTSDNLSTVNLKINCLANNNGPVCKSVVSKGMTWQGLNREINVRITQTLTSNDILTK
jgi:hypothetical protein